MTKSEIRQLAIELAKAMMDIAGIKKCEWITEQKVLKDFPFSKDKLKQLRYSGKLEWKYHWKYTDNNQPQRGRGRSRSIIYHGTRLNEYLNNL